MPPSPTTIISSTCALREHVGPRLPEEVELLLAADERHLRRRRRPHRPVLVRLADRPGLAQQREVQVRGRRGRARCRGPSRSRARQAVVRRQRGRHLAVGGERAHQVAHRALVVGVGPRPRGRHRHRPARCRARGAPRPGGGARPVAARRPRGAPGRPSRRPPRRASAVPLPSSSWAAAAAASATACCPRGRPAGGLRAQLLRLGQVQRPGPAQGVGAGQADHQVRAHASAGVG